jgi:hypothetical protein
MNSTQVQTSLASVIAFVAGILAAKFTFFDAATWSGIISGLVGIGAIIWPVLTNKNKDLVNKVAAMPEVKEVSLDKDASGTAALNAATASNVIVK